MEVEANEILFFPKWYLLWMFITGVQSKLRQGVKHQGVLMPIKTNSSYGSCPEEVKFCGREAGYMWEWDSQYFSSMVKK